MYIRTLVSGANQILGFGNLSLVLPTMQQSFGSCRWDRAHRVQFDQRTRIYSAVTPVCLLIGVSRPSSWFSYSLCETSVMFSVHVAARSRLRRQLPTSQATPTPSFSSTLFAHFIISSSVWRRLQHSVAWIKMPPSCVTEIWARFFPPVRVRHIYLFMTLSLDVVGLYIFPHCQLYLKA